MLRRVIHRCPVCDCVCTGKKQLREHSAGRKHLDRVAEAPERAAALLAAAIAPPPLLPPTPPLRFLADDGDVLVVNKPAGLLVHRTSMAAGETDTLLDRVAAQLSLRSGRAVHAVHRLDRATSGAIVLARTTAGASALCEAFRARQPQKWYICVVRGWMGGVCGVIDAPLSVADPKNERRARQAKRAAATLARSEADRGDGDAADAAGAMGDGKGERRVAAKVQAARTEWRQLATVEVPFPVGKSAQHATTRYALVAASPRTGRTHQIRRHLKKHGHPIVGDARYGDLRHSRAFRERLNSDRLLLHSRSLRFHWPSGAECAVVAPLPPPMLELFGRLGWPGTEAAFDAAFGVELGNEVVGAAGR